MSRECYHAGLTDDNWLCFLCVVVLLVISFLLCSPISFFCSSVTGREEEESVGSAVDVGVGNLK